MKNDVKLFGQQKVRTHWDEKAEKWYFSIIDVIEILTGTDRGRKYWNDLKRKLQKEGSELSDKIGQLKMQSIPSPKAEPFKQWLAKTGYERMKEIADPEQSLDRARENWQKLGRSEKWIQQRMTGQETRNNISGWEAFSTPRSISIRVYYEYSSICKGAAQTGQAHTGRTGQQGRRGPPFY